MEADQTVKEMDLCFEPLELYLLKTETRRTNVLFEKIRKKIEPNARIIIYGAGNVLYI